MFAKACRVIAPSCKLWNKSSRKSNQLGCTAIQLMMPTNASLAISCYIKIILIVFSILNTNAGRVHVPTLYGTKFVGYEFLSISPSGIQDCVINCMMYSKCSSFNYYRSNLLCEMNTGTYDGDGTLVGESGCQFGNISTIYQVIHAHNKAKFALYICSFCNLYYHYSMPWFKWINIKRGCALRKRG